MVHVPVSYRWLSAIGAVFAPAFLGSTLAQAHIELTEPLARYDADIKGCPCGKATGGGGSNRTCKVAQDGSDPNRNEARVFTAATGSTLLIKFTETVGHAGRYRVAFDADGADFDDFNEQVLAEIDDPDDGSGAREIEVTLPDTACSNCTLQVIQVMDPNTLGKTVDGSQLANLSTYYSCIDLVLTGGADTGDTGEVTSEGGSSAESGSSVSFDSASSLDGASSSDVATTTAVTPGTPPAIVPPGNPPVNPTPPTPVPPPAPVPSVTPPAVPVTPTASTPAPSTTPPAASTTPVTPSDGLGPSPTEEGCSVAAPGHSAAGGLAWALVGLVAALGLRRRAAPTSR